MKGWTANRARIPSRPNLGIPLTYQPPLLMEQSIFLSRNLDLGVCFEFAYYLAGSKISHFGYIKVEVKHFSVQSDDRQYNKCTMQKSSKIYLFYNLLVLRIETCINEIFA